MPAPEFIAIGHVTLDRFGDEVRPGGSALYAAITADRLGLRAGILTSHADDFPLDLVPPRIEVVSVPAPATTVFEHERVGDDRAQRVTSVAGALSEADVPDDWRDADLVMWDNRCVMHRRDAFDPNTRRVMHRTQIKGDRPF